MASASEIIVPIGAQKHDPAWKHCLMIRSGGRVKLKCVYCMKHFLGGGIHRIKEHLARQKGNASCCPKVPREVQEAMLQSLEGVAARKKKRVTLAEEMKGMSASAGHVDGGELESPIHMIPLNEMLDMGAVPLDVRQDKPSKCAERGRKKRARPSSPEHQLSQPVMTVNNMVAPCKPFGLTGLDKDQVYMAVGRFLYDAGVPLEAVNSVYFQPMLNAIASARARPGAFSYHDFRGCILKKSLDEVTAQWEFHKGSWARTGCSVLVDEWTTDKGKTLINFSVYSPEGTVYLKSIDTSNIVTSPDALHELLKHVVEEVGEKNVVQVITSNSEIHMAAGKRLGETFPTLFWSPCTLQRIDGMLEDFSELGAIGEIITQAKAITGFIYNNTFALNLMRKHLHGNDLLVPAETRAAMNFVTLKNMYSLKDDLQSMVSSEEWIHCLLSKKPGGITVSNLVDSSQFWSSCAAVVRITEPLVRLLKIVVSNKRPTMGYVYAGLYRAKEAIKKELVRKNDYMVYWNIIDWRWGRHTLRPLHSAGFFLNPLFFDAIRGDISNEVSSGMLDCIERLVSDVKTQDKIQKELNLYRSEAAADFRRKMAIRARRTLPPADWWYTYGGACPNLTRLAVRILSQNCSARGCNRARIPFDQIHNQKMNLLERQRLHDLTFVQYNLRLQQRQQCKAKAFDPISLDNIDIVDDWVVDRTGILSASSEQPNWMEINEPTKRMVSTEPSDDELESFIEGIDEETIRGAARGAQEDDDDCKEEDESHAYTHG